MESVLDVRLSVLHRAILAALTGNGLSWFKTPRLFWHLAIMQDVCPVFGRDLQRQLTREN